MICPVFQKPLKLCLPGMVNFPLHLHSCLSQFPINLSGYLSNSLHQEVLVGVLHTDHGREEMAYVGFWGLLVE